MRNRSEMLSTSCEGCPFIGRRGCEVPGGVCVYRAIAGVPGYCVGDVLQAVGVVSGEWRNELPLKEK